MAARSKKEAELVRLRSDEILKELRLKQDSVALDDDEQLLLGKGADPPRASRGVAGVVDPQSAALLTKLHVPVEDCHGIKKKDWTSPVPQHHSSHQLLSADAAKFRAQILSENRERSDFARKIGLSPIRRDAAQEGDAPNVVSSDQRGGRVPETTLREKQQQAELAAVSSKDPFRAKASTWRRFLPPTHALEPPPKNFPTNVPESSLEVSSEGLLADFKLHKVEERDHRVYLNAQQILDGNELKFMMQQSLSRVDRILSSFNKGERFRDMYSYEAIGAGEVSVEGPNGSGDNSAEELREIVRVLLKELQVQSDNAKEQERVESRRAAEHRVALDELAAVRKSREDLQRKYDDLFAEKVLLQKEVSSLEATVEKMRNQFARNPSLAMFRQNSMFGGGHTKQQKKRKGSASKIEENQQKSSAPADDAPVVDGRTKARSETTMPPTVHLQEANNSDEDGEEDEELHMPAEDLFPVLPVRIPTGDVTIVCTAIHSVDRLWELFPSEMPLAIALHNRLMHEAVLDYDGYEVKTSGTDVMAVFQDVRRAVDFAAHVQLTFAQQHWPNRFDESSLTARVELPSSDRDDGGASSTLPLWYGLRVRIGIHRGPAHVEPNPQTGGYDYMGVVVNKAVLLRRLALGGMACVSKDVYQLIVDTEGGGGGGVGAASVPAATPGVKPGSSFAPSNNDDGPAGTPLKGGAAEGSVVSVSYAENLRRRSSVKSVPSGSRASDSAASAYIPTIKLSLTYHSTVPATRNTPASDVFCLLPLVLEDRLTSIRRAMQETASIAHSLSMGDAMSGSSVGAGAGASNATVPSSPCFATGGATEASDLESLLGNYATSEGQMFATGDGVADLLSLDAEGAARSALQRAQLPEGNVTLVAMRVETMSNQKFLEKAPQKDVCVLLSDLWTALQVPLSTYKGNLYYKRDDLFLIAFSSSATALRFALAADAELTTNQWSTIALSYKETQPIAWRGETIFSGLRVAIGMHTGHMSPHFDPVSREVGYVGPDAFMAMRLASIAKAGQIVVVDRVANDVLLQVLPSPFFMNIVSGRTKATASSAGAPEDGTELLQLVAIVSKCYIGRYFHDCGLIYPNCRKDRKYRQLRAKVLTELSMWQRRATMMMPKELTSAAGSLTLALPASSGDAAAAAISGPEQDFETCTALTVVLLDCLRKQCLPEKTRDAHVIVAQVENLEHNRMLVRDTIYAGQPVSFRPLFADLPDLRLLAKYFDDRRPAAPLPQQGPDDDFISEPSSRVVSARRPSSGQNRDGPPDSSGTDVDDDDSAVPVREVSSEDVAEKTRREVLVAHKVIRTLLAFMKQWMEPIAEPATFQNQYLLTDEDIVSKIIHYYRTTEEETLGRKQHAAKSNSEQWRRIAGCSLDDGHGALAEEQAAARRLCRSLVSLTCKHFLFMRQFVKRVRMTKSKQR